MSLLRKNTMKNYTYPIIGKCDSNGFYDKYKELIICFLRIGKENHYHLF